jgi:hypothetical protein
MANFGPGKPVGVTSRFGAKRLSPRRTRRAQRKTKKKRGKYRAALFNFSFFSFGLRPCGLGALRGDEIAPALGCIREDPGISSNSRFSGKLIYILR